ncbi:MAG TPA: hypothetical protein PK156_25965 [Polyangium sp.]|nr:hypothetical protein [Polyangium sp.]
MRMQARVHAGIVEVFERYPEALIDLLQFQGHALPEGLLVRSPETQIHAAVIERRVDRVFLQGSSDAPQGFFLLEVQRRNDPSKRFTWPFCLEFARSRYCCEGALVVVTTHEKVRRWIRDTIAQPTGTCGTSRKLEPTVIALDTIPLKQLLCRDKLFMVPLAVAAHIDKPSWKEVTEKALRLTFKPPSNRLALTLIDVILGMLDDVQRREVEQDIMEPVRYRSETLRRWYAEATAEGKAEGKAEGRASALVEILRNRNIVVPPATEARILACRDEACLSRMMLRALTASSIDDVVRDELPATNSTPTKNADRSLRKTTSATTATKRSRKSRKAA